MLNNKLSNEQIYILHILRKSLSVQSDILKSIVATIDSHIVAQIVSANGIILTVYQQLPDDIKKVVNNLYNKTIKQAVLQQFEGDKVFNALKENGFDCVPLKGWQLRKYYPQMDMRQMADIDVLVRPYRYRIISSVMEKLGYASEESSPDKHDSFKKKEVNIEIHKRLTDILGDIREWEQGLWDRAVWDDDANYYCLSKEDFYIHHFVHLYRDFTTGSLGLRRIVDTWLLQKHPVDMNIVSDYLQKFGMWNFHEKMIRLSRAAMGEVELDDSSITLLNHAFEYGVYGTSKSYKASRITGMGENLNKGKAISFMSAIFLPYTKMKAKYPILNKCPVLLPFFWLDRIIRFLKGDRQRYRKMLDYSDVTERDYEETRRYFEAGGVAIREIYRK